MTFSDNIDAEQFLAMLSEQAATEGPSASDAVMEIVKAEGDLDLAGERLFGPTPLRPERGWLPQRSRLIALLANDPQAILDLQKNLRILTMLQTYSSARKIGAVVEGLVDRLPSDDLVKLYGTLLTQVGTLTDDHTINQNLNANLSFPDALASKMPPHVAEAFKVLAMEPVNDPSQPALSNPARNTTNTNGHEDDDEEPTKWSVMDPLPNAADGTA